MIAAVRVRVLPLYCGGSWRVGRGRKVRTPQGSVPDNVRDVCFKAHGRPVQQRRYRPRSIVARKRAMQAAGGKGEKVR
jgi:hypothetical protein